MRSFRTVFLAGAAVVAVGGFAGLAVAQINNTHVLTVRLPDGSVEQIRYLGDKAPEVKVESGPAAFLGLSPAADRSGSDSPFAALARLSAAMDRQAAVMLQQAESLPQATLAGPNGFTLTSLGQLPPGARAYSMVSTTSGNGVCTQSVQYTSTGDGKPPRVLTSSSGDCGAAPRGASTLPAAAAPARTSSLVQTNYKVARPASAKTGI